MSLIVSSHGDDLLLSGDDLLQAVVVAALGTGNLLALGGQYLGAMWNQQWMQRVGNSVPQKSQKRERKSNVKCK